MLRNHRDADLLQLRALIKSAICLRHQGSQTWQDGLQAEAEERAHPLWRSQGAHLRTKPVFQAR